MDSVDSTAEEWRPVIGMETLYSVSSFGRIRSDQKRGYRPAGRILKLGHSRGWYAEITLFPVKPDGTTDRHIYRVHRLVAEAFLGPCPPKYEVNHKDANKDNPRLDNLEYVTKSGNMKHAYDLGLLTLPKPKLTPDDVRHIRKLLASGLTQKKISLMYGVCQTTIGLINTGRRWSSVK